MEVQELFQVVFLPCVDNRTNISDRDPSHVWWYGFPDIALQKLLFLQSDI